MNSHTEPSLIVYGGSFDPPHAGHRQSLMHIKSRFPKAKLMVLPSPAPAGASGQHKTPAASFQQRVEMCELAFHSSDAKISTFEAKLPAPNLTVTTLQKLKEQHPAEVIGLLIGQDQLLDFPKWHQPAEILNLASLIVMKRTSNDNDYGELSAEAKKIAQIMELNLHWNKLGLIADIESLKANIYLEDFDICPAESRIIRDNILKEQPIIESWLDKKVLEYIDLNRLYSLDSTQGASS